MNRNTKPRCRLEQTALPRVLEVGRRRAGRWLEGLADESGILRSRDVVEVLHRRLDVRVAHPLLDAADVGDADDPRSEGAAEVVEAERSQCGSFERGAVALRKRRAVEAAADDAAGRGSPNRRSHRLSSAAR